MYQHGIDYDLLPQKLIAYDLFAHDSQSFLPHAKAVDLLETAGFSVPVSSLFAAVDIPLLQSLRSAQSHYCSYPHEREGIVVRDNDSHIFKMVNSHYVRNALYNNRDGLKNSSWR